MSISEIKPSFIKRMKDKVKKMKRDTLALYYSYRHPETPFTAKLLIGVTVGYLMSPIDLIPDFIPVLGLLDDLLIVPFLIVLSIQLIPKKVWEASLQIAISEPIQIKKAKWFVFIIVLIWLLAVASIYFYLLPSLFTQS